MSSKILITENIKGRWVEELQSRFDVQLEPELWKSPEKLYNLISDYDALIVRNQTDVDSVLIDAGIRLKIIGRAGAGLDNINVEAAAKAGIVVTSTPDQNSISVAESTIGMMLALARMLPAANTDVRNGNWQRQKFVGTELYGKTFGVIGLGRIGFLTALRANALGMNILAHDAYISADAAPVTETHAKLVDLETLLRKSDFISCHIPLTPETRHIFNYKRFSQMKPESFFMNLSRGGVVDEQDLIKALENKKIKGAALDVREQEPPVQSALSEMDNVILTPHIAAFTHEAQERVVNAVCQDVAAVLEGNGAKNSVNFPKPKQAVEIG
ncbi:MAG: hydroxyacid dehydrogenase [Balneolaceae bacterium]